MSTVKTVAIAGATGNLGPSILQALLDAKFEVTVLTRASSSHSFPPTVTVKPVDFTSVDALVEALTGIDAVVSAITLQAVIPSQLNLIEAAAKVGTVKRFIPSDFGSDTYNPLSRQIPIFKPKIASQEKLKELSVPYTAVISGPFLDWGINVGFILNAKEKKVTLWDGGERTFSATTLPSIGKAVAGVLNNLEATKNRAVYTQSALVSPKKLFTLAKEIVGEEGWDAPETPLAEAKKAAEEEGKKEHPTYALFVNWITVAVYGEGYGGKAEKVDNELLGVPSLSDENVKGIIRGAIGA